MVRCIPAVSIHLSASFFDVRSRNRGRLFSLHVRSIAAGIEAFFRYRYRTDAGGIGRYRVPDASIGLTLTITQTTDCRYSTHWIDFMDCFSNVFTSSVFCFNFTSHYSILMTCGRTSWLFTIIIFSTCVKYIYLVS